MALFRCIALAAAIATNPPPAHATDEAAPPGGDPGVLVLPLQIDGDVGEAWHADFTARLHAGLARRSATVVDAPEADCPTDDRACWRSLAHRHDARFVVTAKIDKKDRDYVIHLELAAASDGEVLATTEQPCELCGLTEVAGMLDDVAATFAARMEALASAASMVLFQSTPPGAHLRLDGADLGPMPLSRELPAGDHRAEATLDDHVSQARTFVTAPGVDQTVRFTLTAAPRIGKPLWAVGWASLGLGLAGVGAGAALIAIDEDPITSRCSGDDVNENGVCKYRRNTLAGGAALVATGAVAVIAGVVLTLVARPGRRARRERVAVRGRGLTLRF
jgi:hypothetical protein